MARTTIERVTDDLDGSEPAETVQIGWQGEWREIDLGERNLAALSKGFDRFWEVARVVRPSTATARTRTAGVQRTNERDFDIGQLRQWAAKNGIAVPARGRIPRATVEQYKRSGGK